MVGPGLPLLVRCPIIFLDFIVFDLGLLSGASLDFFLMSSSPLLVILVFRGIQNFNPLFIYKILIVSLLIINVVPYFISNIVPISLSGFILGEWLIPGYPFGLTVPLTFSLVRERYQSISIISRMHSE